MARDTEIVNSDLQTASECWARGLKHRPLKLTHHQWLYRNTMVHYKLSTGLTVKQHDKIMEHIENMIADMDPTDLLPEHRFLLNSIIR